MVVVLVYGVLVPKSWVSELLGIGLIGYWVLGIGLIGY
jgi:hypothetical protein